MSDAVYSKLQYILYEKPEDPTCQRLRALIPNNMRIALQDISKLKSRPPWLTGVPYLIRLSDDKHLPGSQAFTELQRVLEFYNRYFIMDRTIDYQSKTPLENPVLPLGLLQTQTPQVSYIPQVQQASPPVSIPQVPQVSQVSEPSVSNPVSNRAPVKMLDLPPPNIHLDGTQTPQNSQLPQIPQVTQNQSPSNASNNNGANEPLVSKSKKSDRLILEMPPPDSQRGETQLQLPPANIINPNPSLVATISTVSQPPVAPMNNESLPSVIPNFQMPPVVQMPTQKPKKGIQRQQTQAPLVLPNIIPVQGASS